MHPISKRKAQSERRRAVNEAIRAAVARAEASNAASADYPAYVRAELKRAGFRIVRRPTP